MFDLLLTNGRVATNQDVQRLDIAVKDETIVQLSPQIEAEARQCIDAAGKLILPGMIDAHTHMGIPIMATQSIDDFESGSVAAACGGITTIIDFTVQGKGQSLKDSIDVRLRKARGKCHVDFGLHVNYTDDPENRLHEIPPLVHAGLRYFKVFSTYRQAGMMVTWDQFRLILQKVDDHGGLLCLHAEDDDLVETLTRENVANGHTQPIYHARSRTPEAEAYAIKIASEIAAKSGAALYIVHLSSEAGLREGLRARENGVKIFLETCPQYLLLTEKQYEKDNGHFWITTPPLRKQSDCDALWKALARGDIDVVATDHCPFTAAQKNAGKGHFHKTPNGIPGVETLFPLLYTYGVAEGRLSLSRMLDVLAARPAEIFGLQSKKGSIRVGADADLVIWDPEPRTTIRAENLHGNADWSPYEGTRISGHLVHTLLRGKPLVENGEFVGHEVFGRFVHQA